MARPKLVIIEWKDPASEWGWKRAEDLANGLLEAESILSAGLYAGEDEKNIYLAMDWKEEECNTQGIIRKELVVRHVIRELPKGYGKGHKGIEVKHGTQKVSGTQDTQKGS